MDNTSNRTLVCSVLYLDIIEYSKRSVAEQMQLKQRFNELLVKVLQQVAANERIVLDTGDGAAVCFLGSPEVAMFVAMDMRDEINANPDTVPTLAVRMGANLGPIRLIKDINGQTNIIGDGINVAQRVMSFADAGTVLVSRSFFEVVSRLSDDYANILRYEGSRTDKHVREHEVYAIGPSIPHKLADVAHENGWTGEGNVAPIHTGDSLMMESLTAVQPSSGVNKKLLAGAAISVMAIAGIATMILVGHSSNTADQDGQMTAASAMTLAQEKAKPVTATVAKESPQAPSRKATVLLRIVPWGEVYVDGQRRGISPPLKSFSLASGVHTVEVRNTLFPVHSEKIDVKPGDKIRIKHTFK